MGHLHGRSCAPPRGMDRGTWIQGRGLHHVSLIEQLTPPSRSSRRCVCLGVWCSSLPPPPPPTPPGPPSPCILPSPHVFSTSFAGMGVGVRDLEKGGGGVLVGRRWMSVLCPHRQGAVLDIGRLQRDGPCAVDISEM